MLEDLYKIQLYNIDYRNTNNILPTYFQTLTPHYYNALEHGHDLSHNVVRLPITKRVYYYYVQCTIYQFLKLIRDTSQSDLDRSLTSSLTQFIAYLKYSIIECKLQSTVYRQKLFCLCETIASIDFCILFKIALPRQYLCGSLVIIWKYLISIAQLFFLTTYLYYGGSAT